MNETEKLENENISSAEETVNETAGTEAVEEVSIADSVRALSPTRLVIKRFFRSKLSIIGLIMIIGLFLFSFIGPIFSPYQEGVADYSTDRMNVVTTKMEYVVDGETYVCYKVEKTPMAVDRKAPVSWEHWLGTDGDGMDVLTQTMYGGRISLTISFIVVILEMLIGVILGGLAGYFGGWVDTLIMRIVDIFSCLPDLPIMLIIGAVLDGMKIPARDRIYYMMVFITLLGWIGVARLVRGQILSLREQEFMVSATARGLSTKRKIFRHLIPNVMPHLIVTMTLGLGGVILMESTLSYLNLGVPKPYAAWGSMISAVDKDSSILQYYFNVWGPPGICIVLAVLGFNFIGDGLRDAFDPKSRK
ncbi:MAG: ABC transporter permease [Clostridia bacterium]|nr:ABC transporter permease [Clostridia bacterium]